MRQPEVDIAELCSTYTGSLLEQVEFEEAEIRDWLDVERTKLRSAFIAAIAARIEPVGRRCRQHLGSDRRAAAPAGGPLQRGRPPRADAPLRRGERARACARNLCRPRSAPARRSRGGARAGDEGALPLPAPQARRRGGRAERPPGGAERAAVRGRRIPAGPRRRCPRYGASVAGEHLCAGRLPESHHPAAGEGGQAGSLSPGRLADRGRDDRPLPVQGAVDHRAPYGLAAQRQRQSGACCGRWRSTTSSRRRSRTAAASTGCR